MTHPKLAVLPFVNMSSDPEHAIFADGITEEIINALARIDQLKVTSRTSSFFFKEKNIPIKEIGSQLGVDIILEGSVRISGNTVRITAQLIDATEDAHFWSETWDRSMSNIFLVQDEVSVLIADKLREQYGHLEFDDHLVKVQTESLDAYTLSLRARQKFSMWNPDEVKESIDLYKKAIEIDPNHADSYVGLADGYSFLATTESLPREEAMQQAVMFTMKASEIDPDHPGVHYQLANLAFFAEADFKKAWYHFEKAVSIQPSYADAQQFMGFMYILIDDFKNGEKHVRLAREIDPLSGSTRFFDAYLLYNKGQYAEAIEIFDEVLRQNPMNTPAVMTRCYAMLMQKDFEGTLHYLDQVQKSLIPEDDLLGLKCICNIHLENSKPDELEILKERAKDPQAHQAHSWLFLSYVHMEMLDEAFAWLRQAVDMRSSVLLLTFSDPLVLDVHRDPRYQEFWEELYGSEAVKSEKKNKSGIDSETAAKYEAELLTYVEEEEPFLDPNISLRSLSERIEIHPNQLSWVLNSRVGKNFNEFINDYRINRFKELAIDPENSHISIIGLAYESGFNSKTVFNTYFKRAEGMTPKQYLDSTQS